MFTAFYAVFLAALMLFNSKFTPAPLSWINGLFAVLWAVVAALNFWQIARRD